MVCRQKTIDKKNKITKKAKQNNISDMKKYEKKKNTNKKNQCMLRSFVFIFLILKVEKIDEWCIYFF